ncbi:MAG: hypothetical protein QOE06_3492 [Thermoleophilaceae bacterium]|nr:hypothetical protein [Thermoleophilaceae bacterium]
MLAALVLAAPGAQGAGLPACPSAPCASDRAPAMILAYWQGSDYGRLLSAVRRSGLSDRTPVYYGNYWGAGRPSRPKPPGPRPPPLPGLPNGRPAPILPLGPSVFWHNRKIPRRDLRILRHAHADARGGRIPPMSSLLRRSDGYRWGRELGRRFRDRIRNKRRHHSKITTWQFDELVSEIGGGPGAARRREVIRGVLDGTYRGRPELGDKKLPGIVYATQRAMATARRGGELGRFWRSVDQASLYVVGEEYPAFTGAPGGAARRESRGQRALGRASRSLALKYVVGMTPGQRMEPGLGGNVRRLSLGAVDGWRDGFVRARARQHPAGFGEYHFWFENSPARVMRGAVHSLAKGVRLSRR